MQDNFINYINGSGDNKRQMICFPYLGGYSNSFVELANNIDNDLIDIIALNPPGHGSCRLQPLNNIDDVIDLYYKKIQPILTKETIFFGHSMGGIIAYFLAQRLLQSANNADYLKALVLSAANPQLTCYHHEMIWLDM